MQIFHIFLMFLLILSKNKNTLQGIGDNDDDTCVAKDECQLDKTSNYKKEFNVIVHEIQEARKSYTPCSVDIEDIECVCHLHVIDSDLSFFQKNGITRLMLNDAAKYGTRYKIYNHTLYRDSNCMFPSRCDGIQHFILKLLPELPDMDLVINTRDWPQISLRFNVELKAVFSFSKTKDYADIMYPAWTFWAGGPAIALYPTGIGRWDLHRQSLKKASQKYAWESKISKGFFRGSRTSDERDSLILLSRKKPHLVDAEYTKNQAWKSPKDTLNAEPAKEVSFEEHCQYKYLFNFRGVAASFRFKHLFLCKSLIFHVGDDWLEFFYLALKPWVHYVPLRKYPTEADIENMLEFFKKNDDLAKEIANAGYEFIWQHLRMQDVECYWRTLLKKYANLLQFKIEFDTNMIEIKSKSN
uniref:CAP10 domain-containing protein n=1 Tax=Glossina brevipalpis TaxID=37001 RepID=A0A1A9W1A1_9MUSC